MKLTSGRGWHKNGRLASALRDPKIRAWHEARKLRTEQGADLDVRKLVFVSERLKLSPAEIVRMAKDEPTALRDLLVRFAAGMKARGRQDTYTLKVLASVAGWLRHNGVEFHQFPKLSPIAGETLKAERVPTSDELRQIVSVLGLRGKVIALALAHAGLRPGVLGNYRGTGGLTLDAFPELRLTGKDAPRFELAPGRKSIRINVPATLSKTRRAYVTFGTLELAEAIIAYLKDRISKSYERPDELGPDRPLVALSPLGARGNPDGPWGFASTKTVVFELRTGISKVTPPGVRWRPYVLRALCSTTLWTARVDREAREAMLGHNLGVSGRYNLSKRLGDGLVDELRSEYEKAVPYLETVARQDTGPKTKEWAKTMLLLAHVPTEEIAKIDLDAATPEEIVAVAQRFYPSSNEPLRVIHRPISVGQRVVPLEKADELLAKGAEVMEILGPNRDKLLLRVPTEARA